MPKPKIDARSAADDIKAGMDDAGLMKKYFLSARGLQSLIRKLVEAGVLDQEDLDRRFAEPEEGSLVIDFSTLSLPGPDAMSAHELLAELRAVEAPAGPIRTADFLKGVLDSSTLVSVIVTDLDQNILFWNKGAENIFGYSAEEMIGQKVTRLYPPDSLTKDMVEGLRELIKSKTGTVDAKMKQVAKDGRMLTIALAVSPVLDDSGAVGATVGIGLDVTEEARQNKEIVKLLHQVRQTQDAAIFALAKLTEAREGESGAHLNRIQEYCRVMCKSMIQMPQHAGALPQRYVDDLIRSSVLHDVGMVAVPDYVLQAKDEMGPQELEIMKVHSLVGGRALQEAVKKLGTDSFLSLAMEIAFYHHEHWDGKGYPFGLSAEEIPLSARIVAIADAYDEMRSDKHEHPKSHEEACEFIVGERARRFDPSLVDVFEGVQNEFRMIRDLFCGK